MFYVELNKSQEGEIADKTAAKITEELCRVCDSKKGQLLDMLTVIFRFLLKFPKTLRCPR